MGNSLPPNVNTYGDITIPDFQPFQSYLPNAFDDNLTLLQKVNMVIQTLTSMGVSVNSLFDNWTNVIVPYVTGDGLNTDVVNQLLAWKTDGTLDTIINQNVFGQINTDLTNIKGVNGKRIQDYPIQTPEVNDSARIQRAFNSLVDQDILLFEYGKTYNINASMTLSSQANPIGFHLIGYGATFKTLINGLTNIIDVQYGKNFSIFGFKFNQNLLGRTSINCGNCTGFIIADCDFTGYSASGGWSTYDGGICCTACYDFLITRNYFHQHGNQYDATTSTLNRCITVQADNTGTLGDRAKIIGNTFYQVNQGIGMDIGESNIIANNIFEEVHDNSIYALNPLKGLVVSGNSFNDKYDECLIMSGGNFVVVGNKFRNSPNKFLGVADGGIASLVVDGNTFDNTGTTTGSFLASRDPSYTIDHCRITNNTFLHPNADGSFLPFYFGNVNHLMMNGNTIKGSFPSAKIIIDFVGTTIVGELKDNYIEGDSSGSAYAFKVETTNTTVNLLVKDNDFVNCYAILDNTGIIPKGHNIQASSGVTPHILGKNKQRQVYYSIAPLSGKWTTGDIVWNTNPSASGNIGWICVTSGDFAGTPPVFKTFGSIGA